jgi:hypothetical protein
MMPYVLVAIGHHRSTPIPTAPPDDVNLFDGERVGRANDRTDVEIMTPVLDCDVQRMAVLIQVSDDRFHGPVSVLVDHVTAVAITQQLRVETRV